jgi:pyruvate/2-oxoglutarate/acetoin dehydrogenase E1 component
MSEVIDNGKTRVINRGVDVAIFVSSDLAGDAMLASRTLVVKGISTAIIEVMTIDPLDEETFIDFAQKTGALVFLEQRLYDAFKVSRKDTKTLVIKIDKEPTVQNIIETTLEVVKSKLSKQ